jgi:hypothetical protein
MSAQKIAAVSIPPVITDAETSPAPLLVDIPTAAKMLSTTIWCIRELHWNRKLRFQKLGKKFVINAERVREFALSFGA